VLTAIGSICVAVGLVVAWIDMAMNGARYASAAAWYMLGLAAAGVVLMAVGYFFEGP